MRTGNAPSNEIPAKAGMWFFSSWAYQIPAFAGISKTARRQRVARMERSVIRESPIVRIHPDYAALHPGYAGIFTGCGVSTASSLAMALA
jgi:hypothetical protein